MRWERIATLLCGTMFAISSVVAAAAAISGLDFVDSAERAIVWSTAWIGWLSALRWREACDISAETVQRIKESWDTP